MAKHDWDALQETFLVQHAATGISVQQWCKQQELNYQTARRYIKPRTAHSAQKKTCKTAHNAQSDISAKKCANSHGGREEEQVSSSDTDDDNESAPEPEGKPNTGRTQSGRFTQGNRHAKGNAGNPNPPGAFVPGNQVAHKHGAYAKYLNADDLFDDAADADLRDELIFTRARALSVTQTMRKIHEDLLTTDSLIERIALYDKLLKADLALDRSIARIESLENTLSKLTLDAINAPRFTADMHRIKAATAKLRAETDKLTAESNDVSTPLSQVVAELREVENQSSTLMGDIYRNE
ncbi:terminase [Yersinia alsatica]|uniref:terminase n=1 Tax=Yersinia alsatica TaxID=2890317 RepID=UPI0032EDE628